MEPRPGRRTVCLWATGLPAAGAIKFASLLLLEAGHLQLPLSCTGTTYGAPASFQLLVADMSGTPQFLRHFAKVQSGQARYGAKTRHVCAPLAIE